MATDRTSSTKRIHVVNDDDVDLHVRVTLGISGDVDAHPLQVLRGITSGTASMQEAVAQAVHRARELRFTWAEIGEALGVTRQTAWERYAGDE